ncbi:MAG: prepilin peptidase [Anaerolineales bacterium]
MARWKFRSYEYNTAMFMNLAIALIGLAAGMLVNYLADILPVRRRLARPVCSRCGQPQHAHHYLFWPRRCKHCGTRRSWRTWIVEILAVALALWFRNSPEMQQRLGVVWGGLLLVYFAVIVVIDIELRLILHSVSLFGVMFGAIIGIYLNGFWATLWGGMIGYGIMSGMYYLGILFTRVVTKLRDKPLDEVALGFGDVNLAGVLGLMLGWPNIIIGLFLSILSAGIVSLFFVLGKLLTRRHRGFTAIPYGPFLILGAVLLLFLPTFTQELLAGISPIFARVP